ncbi:unnamed protein product, partial [Ectocarpus sp. 4 AP-2014]
QASLARKFAPLADRILVRRLVAKTQTAGGVYLPDSKLGKSNEGEVVAVGPGRVAESGTKIEVNVKVGETVLLPEYGGTTLTLGDEELSLFRDEDILGKFHVSFECCRTLDGIPFVAIVTRGSSSDTYFAVRQRVSAAVLLPHHFQAQLVSTFHAVVECYAYKRSKLVFVTIGELTDATKGGRRK